MENNQNRAQQALAALDVEKVRQDLIDCQRMHDSGWMKPGVVAPYGEPGLCGCCEKALECGLLMAALRTIR